jgi:glycosyltransferase involved in cell wall biosynthesis
MKILHVLTDMDPKKGGVCQAVRSMIYGLSDLKHHNEVVCLNSPDAPFLKDDKFKVTAIGEAKGPWAYHPDLSRWLLENFSRFDAVIIHGLWQYHAYAVEKTLRKHKSAGVRSPRLFVMPHGMLDPYFQRAEGRKLKAIRNVVYWKLIERKVVNRADGLLFTCEEERLLARTTFTPYRPSKEHVVGLGVENPPEFDRAMTKAFLEKCPQAANQPYILFLSRIHEKKGVDLLVKTYIDVFKNSRQADVKFPNLVIAGPGLETGYGQEIKKMVLESNLKDSIFFPGMLMKESKWGAFYGCQAFVLPSHQENFGIAVVESLACGKPVLISNQVNIWREIEKQEGGIIADDTIDGTRKLIEGWTGLSKERQRYLGVGARRAFEANFAMEPAARRLAEAITV